MLCAWMALEWQFSMLQADGVCAKARLWLARLPQKASMEFLEMVLVSARAEDRSPEVET